MDLLLIEPMGQKLYFLNSLLDRPDEMMLLDSRNLWFFIVKERSDNSFNVGRGGFRVFKEAFKIEDCPFGVDEEIEEDEKRLKILKILKIVKIVNYFKTLKEKKGNS